MKKYPTLSQKISLLVYEASCRCQRLSRLQKSFGELYRLLQKQGKNQRKGEKTYGKCSK